MKRILCLGVFLWASFANAHVTPMYPIEIEARLDGQRLRLMVDGAAGEWVEDVLGLREFPAGEWGREHREKSERFINDHFTLALEGQSIPGRVIGGRVVQQPWQSPASARVRIRVVYDLPSGGDSLEGRAFFFKEEWELHEGAGKPIHGLVRRFETILTVRGDKTFALTIPIQRPDFVLKRTDMARSVTQQKLESFARGLWLQAPLILWGVLLGCVGLRSPSIAFGAVGYGIGLFLPAWHFPFAWMAPFVGAGMVFIPSTRASALAAVLSGTMGGLGAELQAQKVGVFLGFDALSYGLFGMGGLFSVAVGLAVGAIVLWSVKRAATACGSDRVMEERERARRMLSMAVAGFSLVWVWRGMVP